VQALTGKFVVRNAKVVLLVEDLESDLILMRVAFQKAKVTHPIQEARDGQEAMDYLSGAGIYADRERYPEACVVITDLKMPKVDGFDLLRWLKERHEFDQLPRIVLTCSALGRTRSSRQSLVAADADLNEDVFGQLARQARPTPINRDRHPHEREPLLSAEGDDSVKVQSLEGS
jgi:CheY-like chemotaxis protein